MRECNTCGRVSMSTGVAPPSNVTCGGLCFTSSLVSNLKLYVVFTGNAIVTPRHRDRSILKPVL